MTTVSLSPTTHSTATTRDSTVSQGSAAVCPLTATAAVRETAQSYLDDLCHVADDEVCFFTAMGQIARLRIEGGVA